MSPEFLSVLEEREWLRLWFILLPICFGFLALIISVVKARKGIALIYITLLAIISVVIPTLMGVIWWSELSDVATNDKDKEWIFNHDGGLIIAPLYATLIANVFWIIAVVIVLIRIVRALIRKADN